MLTHAYSQLTRRRFKIVVFACLVLSIGAIVFLLLPKPELSNYQSYSQVVYDREGQLLRLSLAQDDRYRLYTPISNIAENIQEATILYEDQDFYEHSGVDYSALLRAFWQTYVLKERRIGASTIVMQLARLRWNIPSNTPKGKLIQIFRALQLSRHYNKQQLLEAYLNLAPYGGNIEGIGAASLVYFNKPASTLSLSEAMTLAVVPQNPSKRNPSKAKGLVEIQDAKKRLAERWLEKYPKDKDELALNALPLAVRKSTDLPYHAPHFVDYLLAQQALKKQQIIKGSIELNIHSRLEQILQSYILQNKRKGFKNASALLLNHKSMQIEAMIGSADFYNNSIHGQVNGTLAKRSPGSTLKPFVYALALDAGLIHPMSMLKDLPHKYAGFSPENFGRGFVGPISAQDALIKSRNVPAVELQHQLIQQQAINKQTQTFYDFLANAGISELKDADFYGLALALGGVEVSMLEIASLYATIANLGSKKEIVSSYSQNDKVDINQSKPVHSILSPEAAFLVFDMLSKNPRPNAISSIATTSKQNVKQKVAWKTGTSWAFRDAWAVAISGDYVLAVWIGNFEGEGNNAFIGRTAAGPLLFNLLEVISQNEPSSNPENELKGAFQLTPFAATSLQALNLKRVEICKNTGDLYEAECPEKSTSLFIPGVSPIKSTNIYRSVWVDNDTGFRQCDNLHQNATKKVFAFWPSDFQNLFSKAGIHFEKPPKFAPECKLDKVPIIGQAPLISSPQSQLNYVVQDSLSKVVAIPLTANADAESSYLYWFANGEYIASSDLTATGDGTPIIWYAPPGTHEVYVSDDLGRSASLRVNVQAVR